MEAEVVLELLMMRIRSGHGQRRSRQQLAGGLVLIARRSVAVQCGIEKQPVEHSAWVEVRVSMLPVLQQASTDHPQGLLGVIACLTLLACQPFVSVWVSA